MLEQLEQYEGLVKKIVAKYQFSYEYDDLYQAGMIGLMNASKKYDATRGSSFLDYAYLHVKGEVLKTLNASHQVKISPELYKLGQEIKKTSDELIQSLGRKPTSSELAYVLGEDVETIEKASEINFKACSLDEVREDENIDLYNKVAKIEMGYDAGILDLKTALVGLEESERQLITSRYYEDMTQQETANILGMSQVQVSRKEQKILQKLRVNLEQ